MKPAASSHNRMFHFDHSETSACCSKAGGKQKKRLSHGQIFVHPFCILSFVKLVIYRKKPEVK